MAERAAGMILDTVAFVRLLRDELSGEVLLDLESAPVLLLSAASIFEINQKVRIGRLAMSPIGSKELAEIEARGLAPVAVEPAAVARAASMEWRHDGRDHRDPFDRMIAAAALEAGLPVATADRAFGSIPGLEVLPI